MGDERKLFFSEPTAAEIKSLASLSEASDSYAKNILELYDDKGLVLTTRILPEKFEHSNKFMKHGRSIFIRKFRNLEQAVNEKVTPIKLREQAFGFAKQRNLNGYTFKPFSGDDRRTRKVSLVECIEGAKIYCYANQETPRGFKPTIDINPYDGAARVEIDGAEIIVKVPSRRKGEEKYKFKFSSVPVIDNDRKWEIAYNISTDFVSEQKRFNIKYNFIDDSESSKVINFYAHEIAGYLSIIDHYIIQKDNITPIEMSQFAIPTKTAARFYDSLTHNCLIGNGEERLRKLNTAEKEILLWNLVGLLGHKDTFYATEKLKDYSWRTHKK